MKNAICITINGFSGAGKSTLAKKIFTKVETEIGKTVILDGDKVRSIIKKLGYKYGYSKEERTKKVVSEILILKLFLINGINVIYPTIGLNYKADKLLKKEIKNFIQVVIRCSIEKIIKLGKKNKVYKLSKKNIVGLDIKPDFPKRPQVIVHNNLDGNFDLIVNSTIKKLLPILKRY